MNTFEETDRQTDRNILLMCGRMLEGEKGFMLGPKYPKINHCKKLGL